MSGEPIRRSLTSGTTVATVFGQLLLLNDVLHRLFRSSDEEASGPGRFTRLSPMAIASLASGLAVTAVSAQVRVGGFDADRGGGLSLKSGSYLNTVRAYMPGACTAPFTISESASLTPKYLAGVDVLVVSSVRTFQTGITPLSAVEQAALTQFVLAGGGLIIFADNNEFGAHDPTAPNGSLLGPFGFGIDTVTAWPDPVSSTDPSPVTAGVSHFNVLLGGRFDVVPANALVLARLDSDQTPILCAIQRGTLGPGSGPVVVFADVSLITDTFIVPWEGAALLNNALAFASPEPTPCYANCDGSRCGGRLNANDFQCFLNRFASGDTYANCDGSTVAPVLTANDFQCFLNAFSAGCP